MTFRAAFAALLCLAATACGSDGSSPSLPTIAPAHQYRLVGFTPSQPVAPGKPVRISFAIAQPSGQRLVHYRTGPGPHTGVHLIIVRDDLNTIIHQHPPIRADGTIAQTVTLPKPGPYRVLVDVYPQTTSQRYVNFQLHEDITARGAYHPESLPPFRPVVTVDGYRFTMEPHRPIHQVQATLVTVHVADPAGRPARFTPWFGAMAHAIFFHEGDLSYFHTHICAPGQSGCTSTVPAPQSKTTAPGKLTLGVLLPQPGRWRLFLQCKVDGRILTAPFTLAVAR